MKKIPLLVGAIALAVTMSGCGAVIDAVDDTPAPSKREKVDDDYDLSASDEAEIRRTALEIVWADTPKDTRDTMCTGYRLMPDQMWKAFDSQSEGKFVKSEFFEFFDEVC